MSRHALERATLAPYRLLASLRSGHRIIPPAIRILAATGSQMEFAQVCLVPGGRFLFTEDKGLIQLWDLGCGSAEGVESSDVALASLQFKDSITEITGFQPTCDGLRIILIVYTSGTESRGVQLYEIDPVSSIPTFELACKMNIDVLVDNDFVDFASSPNRVAFYHNLFITVLDFIQNRSSTWTIPSSCSDIFLMDDHVILINDEGGFAIWKIPPLEPFTLYRQNHTTATQTAFFTLPKTDSYFDCSILHPPCS
ncbi:hypothetical protein Hypma_002102 [Hypsizygus marmoreus]|uniref:Uncharacterized protein n=1 Tax=Hypsizygus marmoreus TaxID=39966 RepID=A0A369K1Z4_HYPMA|nr:hypothetical protein Hypma_002102 [Hypsizygus marmoreus]